MNRYNIIQNIYFVYKIKKCFIKSPRAVSMSLCRRFIHFIRSVKIAMLENISIYIAKAFVALRNSRCSAKRERERLCGRKNESTQTFCMQTTLSYRQKLNKTFGEAHQNAFGRMFVWCRFCWLCICWGSHQL